LSPPATRDTVGPPIRLSVEILPFDAQAGIRAAELRHNLERAGEAIGPLDTLIAATALSHGGVLVTRNLREFARVPGLKTLNWHD